MTKKQAYYKVLGANGEAIHGGAGTWSLPVGDQPGEWMPEIPGDIIVCWRGYHLTTDPQQWFMIGARVFEVEPQGKALDRDGDKIAVRSARLLREVDWAQFNVFVSGDHEVSSGTTLAYGSASVRAYGSASVTAYGSASVTAYDSASVTAYDSASVTASGSASVTAYDSASVTAYSSVSVTAYGSVSVTAYGSASVTAYDSVSVTASGSASVSAYDSASVRAYDSASVTAYGSASVTASGSASVTSTHWHSVSAIVTLEQMAAHIDRRGGKFILRSARSTHEVPTA